MGLYREARRAIFRLMPTILNDACNILPMTQTRFGQRRYLQSWKRWTAFEKTPHFHVAVRPKCTVTKIMGWIGRHVCDKRMDTLDEVKANMLGYTTQNFPDLKIVQYRTTAWKSAFGKMRLKTAQVPISRIPPLVSCLENYKKKFTPAVFHRICGVMLRDISRRSLHTRNGLNDATRALYYGSNKWTGCLKADNMEMSFYGPIDHHSHYNSHFLSFVVHKLNLPWTKALILK